LPIKKNLCLNTLRGRRGRGKRKKRRCTMRSLLTRNTDFADPGKRKRKNKKEKKKKTRP